jgi:hypothetical protein
MPTPEEIRAYQERRGRFINALWDAEDETDAASGIEISRVLARAGDSDLPDHKIARLLNDLVGDQMLEPRLTAAQASYPLSVRLTSYGRLEAERWITEDVPTEHLAIPPSQIFNTHFHGTVAGSSIVVGSSGTTVNMQNHVAALLPELVAKASQLLAEWDGSGDEREEIAADIDLLADAAGREAGVNAGRTRAALRRLARWAQSAAVAGAYAELSGEVQHLTAQVLGQI